MQKKGALCQIQKKIRFLFGLQENKTLVNMSFKFFKYEKTSFQRFKQNHNTFFLSIIIFSFEPITITGHITSFSEQEASEHKNSSEFLVL